jgi:hypothetical protein
MKKIFTVIGFIFSISAFAQNGDAIVNALKEGSAPKFSSYFDNNLDIKLPKQKEMQNVNKADAETAVNDFFRGNNINGFEVISQREMSGTMYIAGKLKSTAQDYNITVMLKKKGDNASIITVRIN